MYYLLIYELVDNYLTARQAFRAQHFEHIKAAQARGEFILGGAFDPAEEAGLLFKVKDKSIIENFVTTDPYVINGLVKAWHIKKWSIVIGLDT